MFDFITVNSIERSVLAVTRKNSNKLSHKNFLLLFKQSSITLGSFFLCLAEKFFEQWKVWKLKKQRQVANDFLAHSTECDIKDSYFNFCLASARQEQKQGA
jgi:hypothetical protein